MTTLTEAILRLIEELNSDDEDVFGPEFEPESNPYRAQALEIIRFEGLDHYADLTPV
jgi:hypothetical protein